jgi:hypothetical protein
MYATLLATVLLGVNAPAAPAITPTPVALAEDGHQHGKDAIHKLGRKKIGDYTVSVILIGEAEAGEKVKFDIKLIDAKADPKALRVWIGAEDAKDDTKTALVKGEKTYAADVTVPKPLPAGAKIWVEVETDSGKAKGSYEMESHDDHKQ